MSGYYRKDKNCLNCGNVVESHYCSYCGQPNLELKEPFWGFIGHSIGHYFHFDSKFFQTLIPLLTKPGQITLDYLEGRRARYIHPVSLYIFVSIVYFLVAPHSTEKNTKRADRQDPKEISYINNELDTNLNGVLPKAVTNGLKSAINTSQFNRLTYPEQKLYIDSLSKLNAVEQSDSLGSIIKNFNTIVALKEDTTYASYQVRQRKLPSNERDNWFERILKKKEIEINNKKLKGNWSLETELEKYRPKQYFLLMPLLAFFIMLNFRKNHIYYIDHLVFTIHGMTAYFIISIVTRPIQTYIFGTNSIISSFIGTGVVIGVIWYLYTGLKFFYKRSRGVTIRKTISLMILYSLSLWITEWIVEKGILYLIG